MRFQPRMRDAIGFITEENSHVVKKETKGAEAPNVSAYSII